MSTIRSTITGAAVGSALSFANRDVGLKTGAMFGAGAATTEAALVSSTIYTFDHAVAFSIAVYIVWHCRQSWEHAASVTGLKVFLSMLLFVWSLMVMFTQTFNPFIYFIF